MTMTRKIISWLPLWTVFLFTLSSCVHDEVYSASDPASGEYTNKSLWKEDEKYIKNVKQIFDEYADHQYFSSSFGTVYWDYATTMGTYDESFLEVPVVKNSKVSFILVAYREGDRIFFKRKEEDRSKEFFQVLLFKDRRQLSGKILEGAPQSKGVVCYTQEITWTWTNDDGSEGPTYTFTETRCEHSGPYLPCQAVDVNQTCGGSGGGYGGGSGGGGGNNGYPYPPTQTPPNPCEKLKEQTTNITFKNNVTTLEGKTGDSYESGFRISNTGQNQLLQNKPGTQQVDLKAFSNTVTLMHSHYDGLYPIFSPGDIIFFNQWVVWAQNWNSVSTNNPKIPLNNLTFTLVTSSGNYSFNFDGTSTTALPNYTQQDIDDLNDKYMRLLDEAKTVANVSGSVTFNMDKLEKQFLKFIDDKMNMTGLKLYKTTTNGNAQLNLVNGNRNEVPCPN